MLAPGTSGSPPTTWKNDDWVSTTNAAGSGSQMTAESMDRETETPATDSRLEMARMPNDGGESTTAESNYRISREPRERSDASGDQPAQRRRKTSENTEVVGDRERPSRTVGARGARRGHRILPVCREPRRKNDASIPSTITSAEAATASHDIPSTILSEIEIISDGNSHRNVRDNSQVAGPSGVRNTRGGHNGNTRGSNTGSDRVRNVAHPSYLTDRAIKVEEPQPRRRTSVKSTRYRKWRIDLKKRTDTKNPGPSRRKAFGATERRMMLSYLVTNKSIWRAKGLVIWQKMINGGFLTDRTPQSLQNHFRKFILPHIEDATWLESAEMEKFLALRTGNNRR